MKRSHAGFIGLVCGAFAASAGFTADIGHKPLTRPVQAPQTSGITAMTKGNVASKAAAASHAANSGSESRLRGYTHMYPYGLQTIPTSQGQEFRMLSEEVTATYGGVEANGVYYAVDRMAYGTMTPYFMAFDTRDWSILQDEDATYEILADDLTFNPIDGKIYGCFFTSSEPEPDSRMFGTVDFSTGRRTNIAQLTVPWNAIAADNNGVIYAIDAYGVLSTVDKIDGSMTRIGDTGLKPKYLSSAAFDPDTNRLYYVLTNDAGCVLYQIDTTTARATEKMVYNPNQEITGIYFEASGIPAKAPGMATDVSATFTSGSLDGTVTFTAPVTLHDGSSLSGELDYEISANGETVASGSTSAGRRETVEVSLAFGGEVLICVTLANDAGRGATASQTVFAGPLVPQAPQDPVALSDGGKVTISWSPVDASQSGDPLASDVTYIVVRYPGETIVAENISETSAVDFLPEPEDGGYMLYRYGVSAKANGMTGPEAKTNPVARGRIAIEPGNPYTNDFNSESSLDGIEIIDANADGFAWTLKDGAAYLPFAYLTGGDDWMMLPPMKLDEGRAYRVRFYAYGFSTECTERVEVKAGSGPRPEDMTITVAEPTEFKRNASAPILIEGYIFPDKSDTYHIGVHGISDPNQWGLYVDDLIVESIASQGVPGPVSDLAVTPDFDGKLEVDIEFTLPDKDIEGAPLSAISKAIVLRDNVVIKEFENPAPGATVHHTDVTVTTGEHLYEVLAASQAGEGRISGCRVFAGINMPGFPTEVAAREPSEGMVEISWKAPEADIDGYPINTALIKYRVAEVVGGYVSRYVADNLSECRFSYQFLAPGSEQKMMQWAVEAYTDGGSRSGIPTDMLSIGRPYEMPYRESFAGGEISYPLGALNLAGKGAWTIHQEEYSAYPSQDADGGFIAMYGSEGGESQALFTGKIHISDRHPVLTYWIGNFAEQNQNRLGLQIDCGDGWKDVRLDVMQDLPETGWNLIAEDLSDYSGKNIRLRFIGTIVNYNYLPLDNIAVSERAAVDLAAGNLIVPSEVEIGQEFEVTVPVTNLGYTTPSGCRVILRGPTDVEMDIQSPQPMQRAEIRIPVVAPVIETDGASLISGTWLAEVIADGDEDTGNNVSPETTMVFHRNALSMPEDVLAEVAPTSVKVTWRKPDLSLEPRDVMEDFEDHAPFVINNIPGWSAIDGDGGFSTGFSNSEFPGMNSKMAFILLDTSHEGFIGNSYASHSGVKHLAFFTSPFDAPNDDWAILPVLSGNAQDISFYAKSYGGADYPESFEVYVSDNEKASAKEDFTLLEGPVIAATSWTRYEYGVPQGVRRFAVRYVSSNQFVLFVDDVCYQAAGPGHGVDFIGYNVYKDGQKMNGTPVAEEQYEIPGGAPVSRIDVSAVYRGGESAAAQARIDNSEVAGIPIAGAVVEGLAGHISVKASGMNRISVYTMEGLMTFNADCDGSLTITAAPGVYLVSVNGVHHKVLVK